MISKLAKELESMRRKHEKVHIGHLKPVPESFYIKSNRLDL